MYRDYVKYGLFFSLFSSIGIMAATDVKWRNEMFSAYADMRYPAARKMAAKHPEIVEARLIKALCAVFDRRQQNLSYGLSELKQLYEDSSIKAELRQEAGLSYARAAQTLQLRKGVYYEADGIDYNHIYDALAAKYPNTAIQVYAIVYQASGLFDSGNDRQVEEGFNKLNTLLQDFRGPQSLLAPIHYLLADQYIIHNKKYNKAVEHLESARKIGLVNPRNCEQVSFRIARIYDFYLHDSMAAKRNYISFIKKFPNSSAVPVARRLLAALEMKNREKRK